MLHSAGVVPVVEVLGYDEVFEMIVDGSLIVLQQRVGVSQTVTSLSLNRSILQLPGQLQRPPDRQTKHTHTRVNNALTG